MPYLFSILTTPRAQLKAKQKAECRVEKNLLGGDEKQSSMREKTRRTPLPSSPSDGSVHTPSITCTNAAIPLQTNTSTAMSNSVFLSY